MSKYSIGQKVFLKSDKSINGVVFKISEGHPENRYTVFTIAGEKTYYESQLIAEEQKQFRSP